MNDCHAPQDALGRQLRETREYLGFTEEEVARHLGLSKSEFSEMEGGGRQPEDKELRALAKLYRSSVAFLTGTGPSEAGMGIIPRPGRSVRRPLGHRSQRNPPLRSVPLFTADGRMSKPRLGRRPSVHACTFPLVTRPQRWRGPVLKNRRLAGRCSMCRTNGRPAKGENRIEVAGNCLSTDVSSPMSPSVSACVRMTISTPTRTPGC